MVRYYFQSFSIQVVRPPWLVTVDGDIPKQFPPYPPVQKDDCIFGVSGPVKTAEGTMSLMCLIPFHLLHSRHYYESSSPHQPPLVWVV